MECFGEGQGHVGFVPQVATVRDMSWLSLTMESQSRFDLMGHRSMNGHVTDVAGGNGTLLVW